MPVVYSRLGLVHQSVFREIGADRFRTLAADGRIGILVHG